jgi:starch synthase
VVPFAKTGGLADVCGALPLALEKLRQEVIVVMPLYKQVRTQKAVALKKLRVGLWSAVVGRGVKVYFIENDAYFNRDGLYGEKTGDYADNLDRFIFFSREAIKLFKEINFQPDVVHCHDWQTSLVTVFLKTLYATDPFFRNTKCLLTIHNLGYQGLFTKEEYPKLGLDWNCFNPEQLEFYGKINLLKGGIVFADVINTVSRTYAKEIQTKEFGFGLEGVLARRQDRLFGIVNGIDYSIWNPAADPSIAKKFSVEKFKDKARDKQDLQKACCLPVKDVPLVGIVSRLAEQKGFDIISEGIDAVCRMGLQLVILGTGDLKYHLLLEQMMRKYPGVISLNLKFDDTLAHKIYAGSDAFLMPSKYEPCGLGQLISFRYGTVPVVFKTGGLADTVTPKTGFIFDLYSGPELVKTMKKAVAKFKNRKSWDEMAVRGMKLDFSWDESAKQYVCLYESALGL